MRRCRTVEAALTAVRADGQALAFVPTAMKTPEVCLNAVKKDGRALKFVPARVKAKAICLEAVRPTGRALRLVSERLNAEEASKASADSTSTTCWISSPGWTASRPGR